MTFHEFVTTGIFLLLLIGALLFAAVMILIPVYSVIDEIGVREAARRVLITSFGVVATFTIIYGLGYIWIEVLGGSPVWG